MKRHATMTRQDKISHWRCLTTWKNNLPVSSLCYVTKDRKFVNLTANRLKMRVLLVEGWTTFVLDRTHCLCGLSFEDKISDCHKTVLSGFSSSGAKKQFASLDICRLNWHHDGCCRVERHDLQKSPCCSLPALAGGIGPPEYIPAPSSASRDCTWKFLYPPGKERLMLSEYQKIADKTGLPAQSLPQTHETAVWQGRQTSVRRVSEV